MHPWARRGLQSALFAGGMLMLGTGIASAQEKVDPDTPAGPLDVGVAVPLDIENIAVGTPAGQTDVPDVKTDAIAVSTGSTIGNATAPLGDALLGNKIVAQQAVPVQITGWALGAAGPAHVTNDAEQVHQQGGPIVTSGEGTPLGGNVVAAQGALPFQWNNFAFGTLSDAAVDGTASQETEVGGPITTNGDNAVGAGNIITLQDIVLWAIKNHAWGWGGTGVVNATNDQYGSSPGELTTSGDNAVASGSVIAIPLAFLVDVGNWAAAWGGSAFTNSDSTAIAEAGTSDTLRAPRPYAATGGDGSLVGGTVLTVPLAPHAVVDCTSAAWGGYTIVQCTDDSYAITGGGVDTSGQESVVGGTAGEVPVAAPVAVNSTAAAWGGEAHTTYMNAANTAQSIAGGELYTDGADSVGGGTVLHPQWASPVEVNCTSGPWGGITSSNCTNDYSAQAGGGDATTGEGSIAGGTVADVPIAIAGAGNHNAGAWGGISDAVGSSTVESVAGGDTYTSGEDSVVGGTTARPQVAEPVEASCINGAWGGETSTTCTHEITTVSGGGQETSGDGSLVGGTTAPVDATVPAIVNCISGDWGGTALAVCDNTVTSEVGGDTYNHGDDSLGGGNIVGADAATPADVFCIAGVWGGIPTTICSNDESVAAGGFTGTSGNDAVGAGNIITEPIAFPVEVFGDAFAWGGIPTSIAEEYKDVSAGGNNNTNDDNGVGASNIVTAPLAGPAQVHGIAGAWGGNPTAISSNYTDVTAGGADAATGAAGLGSGNIVDAPGALPVGVYGIEAVWGGHGVSLVDHVTTSQAGGPNYANGDNGLVAGNVFEAPYGGAVGVFGWAINWLAQGWTVVDSDVTSQSGGPTYTTGIGGLVAGNAIAAQIQALVQAFGIAPALMGTSVDSTDSVTDIQQGGPIMTNGTGGLVAGEIISAEPQAIVQAFGWVISALGFANAVVNNDLTAVDGGDETTAGDGLLGGLLIDAPVGLDFQLFRWAIVALANAYNNTNSVTDSQVGGTPTAPMPIQIPVGLLTQVKDLTVPVAGDVLNTGTDTTTFDVGPNSGAILPITFDASSLLGSLSGVAPMAREERSAPVDVPLAGSAAAGDGISALGTMTGALSDKVAEATAQSTGNLGTLPGYLGSGASVASGSRAGTPTPSLPTTGLPTTSALPSSLVPHVPSAGPGVGSGVKAPNLGNLLPQVGRPQVNTPVQAMS